MQNIMHAHGAGRCTPINDEAPAGDVARGFKDHSQDNDSHFRADGIARQAADVIEGEQYAAVYFDRLRAGMSRPGELAGLLSFLTGEMLHGACRVIEKALEGRRNA